MGLLDGKVAIVTGAGGGIGKNEALLLARQGARVIVNDLGGSLTGDGSDRSAAQLVVDEIIGFGGVASANHDDIASWEGAKSLISQALSTYGNLDILVNNAGILRDAMSFNMDESDWDSVIRVHLKGHFAPTHFAAQYWRERAKAGERVNGSIINTSSESGLYGNAGQANYSAAKAGIASMTLVLSRELERYGVRVNAIAPRARTRMTESTFGDLSISDAFDVWDPANVAPMVAWLASDQASSVSGQIFVVYGATIELIEPFRVVNSIKQDRQWTVEEIDSQQGNLFGERSAGVPKFPVNFF
jgi:NAD(P)-dependent dehydrogenase (short-subunit alcohol dehydrogenase family)